MDKVILIGAFHEMIELCQEAKFEIVGLIDNDKIGTYMNIPILGKDNDAVKLFEKYSDIPVVITPDSPAVRKKLYKLYAGIGFKFQNIISPYAKISPSASIGEGVVVQYGANISSGSKICDFVKLNTCANVMHDCTIDSYTTIAPNAVVLGYVNIGNACYIGANSTILPNLNIGTNSVVGAGAVVTKNVKNNIIVKGVPAQ